MRTSKDENVFHSRFKEEPIETILNIKLRSRDIFRILRRVRPEWKIYPAKLGYYRRTGLVDPERRGIGRDSLYSMTDVILLATISELLEGGLPTQVVRKVIAWLREHASDLVSEQFSELWLAVTSNGDTAWYNPDDLHGTYGISVLKRPRQRYLLPTKTVTLRLFEAAREEGLLEEAA